MPTNHMKIKSFATELSIRGYDCRTHDFAWSHPNGALLSVEFVEDCERIHGTYMVARVLDVLDHFGHMRGLNISINAEEEPFGTHFHLKVQPMSLLDYIAMAAV